MPEWAGEWKVEVIDGEGNVVSEKSFSFAADVSAAAAAEEAPMSESAPAEATGEVPAAAPATE
jgi:hypothetical protein